LTADDYDKTSARSIYEYSKKLTGKSLAETVFIPSSIANSRNRGDLGSLVENFFFVHRPESNHGPDFADAGLELKTTGVVKSKKGGYRAKERLVLTMIDFEKLVEETWDGSSLLAKCRLMLILFYLYEKDRSVVDRRFVLDPLIFEASREDMSVIQKDWETIQKKIRDGRAHELSEGDTFYLGACRKGSGGDKEALRSQPYSSELAKARAFSFKASYVNTLIQNRVNQDAGLGVKEGLTFEEATRQRFAPYIGLSIDEISESLSLFKAGKNQKGFHKQLANRILAASGEKLSELEKADIEMKTIRLSRTNRPKEHMSFPGFSFMAIGDMTWEESTFFDKLERKFLFIIFRTDTQGVERLEKVAYWNMPYEDRLEAQKVWEETQRLVQIDATRLPGATENRVAHVRPKAKNAADKAPTPQGGMHTKQGFWLNNSYIESVIDSL